MAVALVFFIILCSPLLLSAQPVRLTNDASEVVMDNGILQVTLTKPAGFLAGINYSGIDNLLEPRNRETFRGYWTLVKDNEGKDPDMMAATDFKIIREDEEQVEVSFTRKWSPSQKAINPVALNVDKRYIMRRGSSGLYTYSIFEHLEGWPRLSIAQARIAFKLNGDKFQYMVVSDNRQRMMPSLKDRDPPRGKALDYPEAVTLVDPSNPDLKGEVDDKYQYSANNEDSKVHGWISSDPPVGFWVITPSYEFRTGGPMKQELTSHAGPISLGEAFSSHYAGPELAPLIDNGEAWKKVFGPLFIHVNSAPGKADTKVLWENAKKQMQAEVESWPYDFLNSPDFPSSKQRGSVSGRLLVRDRYINAGKDVAAKSANVGLALPGDPGSWQRECKGYQFWIRTDSNGNFKITNVRAGDYNLYAWVPGFIGDFKYEKMITITEGSGIDLGEIVYEPPRDGPTLWEIGIPDRTAAEFYIPDPKPNHINKLYVNHPDRFRQYGLWERYTELYPKEDLVYTVGVSDYQKDWFYAQVTRLSGNKEYVGTTWQIKFKIKGVSQAGMYKLRIALASSQLAHLEVRLNDIKAKKPIFASGMIGRDNAIARHGIHGLYWLFNIDVPGLLLVEGDNTIFLSQVKGGDFFRGFMYDYIRLEGPPGSNLPK